MVWTYCCPLRIYQRIHKCLMERMCFRALQCRVSMQQSLHRINELFQGRHPVYPGLTFWCVLVQVTFTRRLVRVHYQLHHQSLLSFTHVLAIFSRIEILESELGKCRWKRMSNHCVFPSAVECFGNRPRVIIHQWVCPRNGMTPRKAHVVNSLVFRHSSRLSTVLRPGCRFSMHQRVCTG